MSNNDLDLAAIVEQQRKIIAELRERCTEAETELDESLRREQAASLRALQLHERLMMAQHELFQLHDAVFSHNIASTGNRPIEELREADAGLRAAAKELIEGRVNRRSDEADAS